MKKIKIIPIISIVILVIFDQITKFLAKKFLEGQNPFVIIPGVFQLQYLENRGAAFGILQNQIIFFLILTIIVLGVIFYFSLKIPAEKKYNPLKIISLFISAGAIGNMIDRLFRHYVIDFFYFEWINFPIFNVADCYVSISSVVLALLFLFYYKDDDFEFLNKEKTRMKKHGK